MLLRVLLSSVPLHYFFFREGVAITEKCQLTKNNENLLPLGYESLKNAYDYRLKCFLNIMCNQFTYYHL